MKHTTPLTLGLDLGNTIVKPGKNGLMSEVYPDAVEIIRGLMDKYFGNRVFIISKVDEHQRVRAESFLDNNNFLADIGLSRDRVIFCMKRRDKAALAKHLGITHFFDDRPEVLAHMDGLGIKRIAYDPIESDMELHKANLQDVLVVKNWLEIRRLFLL